MRRVGSEGSEWEEGRGRAGERGGGAPSRFSHQEDFVHTRPGGRAAGGCTANGRYVYSWCTSFGGLESRLLIDIYE